MKKIWCLALLALAFLAQGICATEVPDLVGDWTGSEDAYNAENGSYKLLENSSVSLSIAEQKDRLFTGNVTYTLNGTEIVEALAGAIGLDDQTFYIAESDKGYSVGKIISDDEIEIIYLEDGESGWAAIEKLYRIK